MFSLVRLAVMGLALMGAMVYAAWTRFGWLAGVGTGLGLLLMLGMIFGIGRKKRSGSVLEEIRRKAAQRRVCRACGTPFPPRTPFCPKCGANL